MEGRNESTRRDVTDLLEHRNPNVPLGDSFLVEDSNIKSVDG